MDLNETKRPVRFYLFCGMTVITSFSFAQNYYLLPFFLGFIYGAFKAYKEGSITFSDLGVSGWQNYQLKEYDKLVDKYESILSFEMVRVWDTDAENEVSSINSYNESLRAYIEQNKNTFNKYLEDQRNLPLLKKIFRYRTKDRFFKNYINSLGGYYIFDPLNDLQEKIEFSPDNKEEQKNLISSLKNLIEDYKENKKELVNDSKEVKDYARLQNAKISNSFFSSPSSRRLDREKNREWKENQIVQLENQKYAISQKIRRLEKQISWLKRIKDIKTDIKAS